MRKRTSSIILVCFITVFMTIVQPVATSAQVQDSVSQDSLDYLKSVMEMIKQKYNGEVSDKQLIEGALKGMLGTMDPYTTYLTNEQAGSFFNELEGSYTGIGITMTEVGDYIKVSSILPDSPAEKAGLVTDDLVVEVDGVDIKGFGTEKAGAMIRGENGTELTLGIIRNDENEITRVRVTRGVVYLDPGFYFIQNGVGYIQLEKFSTAASNFINRALKDMDKNGVTKLVLDLRDNPGGKVDIAIDIADKFVPSGIITRLDYKDESIQDKEYTSSLEQLKYKLVVLVNGNSASASEIVAGAIQDTKAGTLVGTKTFGKARVQNMIPILTPEASKKYESQLGIKIINGESLYYEYGIDPLETEVIGWTKITTGRYYTPNGRMIDKEGIVPDMTVENIEYINGVKIALISRLTSGDDTAAAERDIYNAELILKALGYNIEKPDNVMGDETRAALKDFQKDSQVEETGELDASTRELLNNQLEILYKQADCQYTKALELLNSNE